jgi:hypothetical protein
MTRYTIQISTPTGPRFIARQSAAYEEGEAVRYVEEAKTWGTVRGAERWMTARPDWRVGRQVQVIAVEMHRRRTTVPARVVDI